MSFINGLEKTAFIAPAVGATIGATKRVAQKATAGVKEFAQTQQKKGLGAYRSAKSGGSVADVGGVSANKAVQKFQQKNQRTITPSEATGIAKSKAEEAMKRQKNIAGIRKGNKQSFASKHPFMTAGGIALGARYALGGSDEPKNQPPPQISYY